MRKLKITELSAGDGAEAIAGTIVTVHYRGTFADGREFDKSGAQPLRFPLGEGMVIEGWETGITGMRVGGRRRLVIPPELAYGAEGSPPDIPPNATLIFEVELVDVSKEKW